MVWLAPLLEPGVRVLDVGAGRAPTLAPSERPPGCRYVGLDVSAAELAAAPPGSYDETVVADLGAPVALDESFDLAISWQVLEHVESLPAALENLRGLLRAGGTLLAQLSGRYAAFALLARALPHRVRAVAMSRWLDQPQEEKFPVRYDHCTARELERLLTPWSSSEIVPFYRGATYLSHLRQLQRMYLAYETALVCREARNLATHYLIIAKR